MKITQLSIFAENRPGQLVPPCRLLADAEVNIRALMLGDTQRFGILRMIVSDWQKGTKVLEAAGFLVKPTEVVAVEVPDRPGGLHQVLAALAEASINIEYLYAYPFGRGENAILIFCFSDPEAAIQRLQAIGIRLFTQEELQEK